MLIVLLSMPSGLCSQYCGRMQMSLDWKVLKDDQWLDRVRIDQQTSWSCISCGCHGLYPDVGTHIHVSLVHLGALRIE